MIGALLLCGSVYSQRTHFTTSRYWEDQKKEIYAGLSVSNFLSDLGGMNGLGKDYSPLDLEFVMTRPGGHIGYRYRFRPLFCTKSQLQYGILKGDDALTANFDRNYRNFRVHTHLIEFSQTLEWIIFNDEHYGKRYSIKGLKGMRNKNNIFYLTAGISGFMFLPQAPGGPFLRPLNTEGQGLPDGPKPYGVLPAGLPMGLGLGIPMGVGYKLGIDLKWRLQFEFTWTKTFTDYLDDVSGTYYDNAAIYAAYGATAAYYADPSSHEFPGKTFHGETRGHPITKDSYMFLNISIVRNITVKRSKKIKFAGPRKKAPKAKW